MFVYLTHSVPVKEIIEDVIMSCKKETNAGSKENILSSLERLLLLYSF